MCPAAMLSHGKVDDLPSPNPHPLSRTVLYTGAVVVGAVPRRIEIRRTQRRHLSAHSYKHNGTPFCVSAEAHSGGYESHWNYVENRAALRAPQPQASNGRDGCPTPERAKRIPGSDF